MCICCNDTLRRLHRHTHWKPFATLLCCAKVFARPCTNMLRPLKDTQPLASLTDCLEHEACLMHSHIFYHISRWTEKGKERRNGRRAFIAGLIYNTQLFSFRIKSILCCLVLTTNSVFTLSWESNTVPKYYVSNIWTSSQASSHRHFSSRSSVVFSLLPSKNWQISSYKSKSQHFPST